MHILKGYISLPHKQLLKSNRVKLNDISSNKMPK